LHITAPEDQEKDEDDNSGEISTGIMVKMSKKTTKNVSNFVNVAKMAC
jgi:hypothetical protein